MSNPNPLALSNATRFRPGSFRGHQRTSSRSPVRKSLFLAKEVDPFLSNLSPDSTLRALQATSTIDATGAGQDILAQSIADASQEEREIGIRAALTAQKLKQWRQELENWPWPSARDRRSGAGFMLPRRASVTSLVVLSNTHVGYLPSDAVQSFQDKIEDIRDGVEALELEDIKDHIFSNHIPPASPAGLSDAPEVQTRFGKLRDFTALVTATVVQALPDMVQVNLLLDTWDIRLAILRQVPTIEEDLRTIREDINAAKAAIRSQQDGSSAHVEQIVEKRSTLGKRVSALGTRIDKLLDLLEGQEDTLPKVWIDSLENIENDYATWVEEAEHAMARKHLSIKTLTKQPSIQIHGPDSDNAAITSQPNNDSDISPTTSITDAEFSTEEDICPLSELPSRQNFSFPMSKKAPESSMHSRKPSLSIKAGAFAHKRDVSEISVAESALSGLSDLSNAEIVDARSTVLLSPKISVVDNPFRCSRDEMSWLMTDPNDTNLGDRPPVLHRASTASIQVVSKDSVRPVTVIRSQSVDILGTSRTSPPSTPSRALLQLTGQDSPRSSAEFERFIDGKQMTLSPGRRKSSMSRHPSLMVQPLTTKAKEMYADDEQLPPLPRRSSKRTARSDSSGSLPESTPSDSIEPQTPPLEQDDIDTVIADSTSPLQQLPDRRKSATLEDRIMDILTTIPTRIRLDNGSNHSQARPAYSTPSTRSCTPVPALTLSPAKMDRANRKANPGDVRIFHLTRSGQSKDAAPVKLFVRSVGENGERVMVRVGGGWADLAEYLQEYSIHHGSRALATGQLEVASIADHSSQTTSLPTMTPVTVLPDASSGTTTPKSPFKRTFSLSSLSNLAVGRTRKGDRSKSLPSEEAAPSGTIPPPVPTIPSSYTPQYSTPGSRKERKHRVDRNMTTVGAKQPSTIVTQLLTPKLPKVVTTPVSASSTTSAPYTPLGASGPKSGASRRAASYNMLRSENEAWVEGMVDKARAVSGGLSTPSNASTVTKDTVTKSGQSGRRVLSADNRAHAGHAMSPSPVNLGQKPETLSRPRSRMGFGDVGSIKRVFLRRKSEKI